MHRHTHRHTFRVWFLLLSIWLGGCATQTQLTNSWRDTAYQGGPFKRVLVMGFGEDGAARRIFEDEFANSLRATGITAIQSYTLVAGFRDTDIDKLKVLLARSGADAVLTTRLISMDQRTSVMPGNMMLMPTYVYGRGAYGYGLSGYYNSVWVQTPPTVYTYDVATLETNLWQTQGENLVWSGTTETFSPSNMKRSAIGFSRIVVKALQAQGLVGVVGK